MGNLIQFPIARLRSRRLAHASVFGAFGELETVERGRLWMMTACAGVALLCMCVLHIALA